MKFGKESRERAMLADFYILAETYWELPPDADDAFWDKAIDDVDAFCDKHHWENDRLPVRLASLILSRLEDIYKHREPLCEISDEAPMMAVLRYAMKVGGPWEDTGENT